MIFNSTNGAITVNGLLIAAGSSSAPILFTGQSLYWGGITFSSTAVPAVFQNEVYQSGCKMEYASIQMTNCPNAAISVSTGIYLNHVNITENQCTAIYINTPSDIQFDNVNIVDTNTAWGGYTVDIAGLKNFFSERKHFFENFSPKKSKKSTT